MAARTTLAPPGAELVARLRVLLARELAWTRLERDGTPLRRRVRLEAEEVLLASWRDGELQGATPEQAFSVRCDESTTTQADFDNGRLILLVGVAVDRPAEFTEIRIVLRTRERS